MSPGLHRALRMERKLMEYSKWDLDSLPIQCVWHRGRRVPLLKTLFSTICKNQCRYCALRKDRNVERLSWTPEKLVNTTLKLWRKGLITGLFLSSGMFSDPEVVVEKQVEVAYVLRRRGFTGYINLRLMPGTPKWLVWEAVKVADRVGVNVEAPDPSFFYEIAPDKGSFRHDILGVLEHASRAWKFMGKRKVLKAGIATQMIVGLAETDRDCILTTFRLIRNLDVTRVYYSPFQPIKNTPLENRSPCPISRAQRLYQAFFLLRDYFFSLKDLESLLDSKGMLPVTDNIKEAYAKLNPHLYPIDVNTASYRELLKIPTVGPRRALKIMQVRKERKLRAEDLKVLLGKKNFKRAVRYIAF